MKLKIEYPSAGILNQNRVVLNIKGNNYRLIVKINYEYEMDWILFIETHKEYDKINAIENQGTPIKNNVSEVNTI